MTDHKTKEEVIVEWLASPKAKRRLADALRASRTMFDPATPGWAERRAGAILAALRERP